MVNLSAFFLTRPTRELLQQMMTQDRMEAVRTKWRIKKEAARSAAVSHERVSHLEEDVGYIALVLASILDRLHEKGVVTKDDVKETIRALDDVDGVRDGRLDISLLRQMASPGTGE